MTYREEIDHAYRFLLSKRELVKLNGIEALAGLPAGTLTRFLNSEGAAFPIRRLDALQRALTALGYVPPTNRHQFI